MSLESDESTGSILSCTSDQFSEFYDANYSTDILSKDAAKIINKNRQRLQAADTRYRLDVLLSAMLEHAPHPLGKRYIAVALHIAHDKGGDMVVAAAKAWMDNLFLPMLALSKATKTEPSSSQTPTIDSRVQEIEGASRSEQSDLRAQVATRELYHCAITGAFDIDHVTLLLNQGREPQIPHGPQATMEAAHIIPFSLNNFDEKGAKFRDAARTWDILQSWTQIDIKEVVGSKINSPANALYMTTSEHRAFGHFRFYLDKDVYPDVPNKYRVCVARTGYKLTNGQASADVEFQTLQQSGVEPPNPDFLRVHAAFAKVLNLCGAAGYFENVERDAERNVTLRLDGGTDFGVLLMSRVVIMAH